MPAIINAARPVLTPLPLHPLATQLAQNGKALPPQLDKAVAAKLNSLPAQALEKLQRNFFETAVGSNGKLPLASVQVTPFAFKAPSEALEKNYAFLYGSYFTSDQQANQPPVENKKTSTETNNQNSKPVEPHSPPQPKPDAKPVKAHSYGAQAKTPGLFSNPTADKAAEAVRMSQAQTQNFLANQLGQSFASGNMAEFLGPGACFEDVLATVMMNIADKSEKEMLEQIRTVERGETGLNGFIANRAKDIGGIAGGALGGYLGGPQGAAVGYDVGERLVGGYAGQYGGSSRQIQFEKLKMMMHKQSEMMSAISNILATIHQTNKNSISNIRG